MAGEYVRYQMKTDAEKSRGAVLAERKRCAAIARKFGDMETEAARWPNLEIDWVEMVRLMAEQIAEGIERVDE